MPELDFHVEGVEVERYATQPTMNFHLRLNAAAGVPVRNVMLQTQIRIEARRRFYQAGEQERLTELFGAPPEWSRTLSGLLWTQVGTVVPAFEGECRVTLPVPASYDFNLAATKYFYGLEQGDVPLALLFSGSIAYQDTAGALLFDPIPWSKETRYRMPLTAWREAMQRYYADNVWLGLSQAVFERVYQYRRRHGLPDWDRTLECLLGESA